MLKRLFHIDHFMASALSLIILWLLSFVTFNLSILDPVADALDEFSLTDVFFDIEHNQEKNIETSDLITIVDMTDLHKRSDIASLMQEISLCNPLCLGVDLIFEGEKDDSIGNHELKEAVTNIGDKAVYSKKLTDYSSDSNAFADASRSFFAKDTKINEAFTNLVNDLSGTRIREFSFAQQEKNKEVLSFPAAIAARFDSTLTAKHQDKYLINYRNVRFPVVKYNEIQDKADMIDGHIVLVGTMTEEQDMHMSPLGKMPGIEIQAYSLLTLLEHENLKELPLWMSLLISFILCYVLELILDVTHRWADNSVKLPVIFLRESGLLTTFLVLFWTIGITWVLFYSFTKWNLILNGEILLASTLLVCQARDWLTAIVKTLSIKLDCSYLKKSIFN